MFDPVRESGSALEPDPTPDSTRSLMERLAAGDDAAFDHLVSQYWAALVAYADRIIGSRAAAEDVVQETLLRVWQHRTNWTPTDRLRSLLYRITRNLSLNERRSANVRERRGDAGSDLGSRPSDSPLELVERREIRDAVARALDALPARRREVFLLSRYHGHTYREIAEIMDISPQTVANTMSAALDELRSLLRPHLESLLTRGSPRIAAR